MEAEVNGSLKAFTLLEILVSLAVATTLILGGVYGYHQAIPRARSIACRQNLFNLSRALQLYLSEHQDVMPTLAPGRSSKDEGEKPGLDTLLLPYLDDPDSLRCPCDQKGLYETTGTSYFWNSLLNGQKSANLHFLLTRDDSLIPVISDKEAFHKGVGNGLNILYANGSVENQFQFQVGR